MRSTLKLGLLSRLFVVALCASACSSEPPVVDQAPATSSSPAPTYAESTGAAEPAGEDDLATGTLRHVIRSSGLTFTVDYETTKPAIPWTAGGNKPLRVEVRVSGTNKKVYLTRASLRFSVSDGSAVIVAPDPLVDTATNVAPGYLVTPPYSYVQSFAVPLVDTGAQNMTIDVKLELVSLVDRKARDYTKQTVTDAVQTVIAS